jgi:tetracycline resistance efflux pump
LSDTTILSSIGSGIHLIDHVTTQMPYALLCALASTVGYLVLGFSGNMAIGLVTALGALALGVFVLKGKYADGAEHEARVESGVPAT